MTTMIVSALVVPEGDLQALSTGRSISITTPIFLRVGQAFALIPDNHAEAVRTADYWASCEHCFAINSLEEIHQLSPLTIWPRHHLEQKFQNHDFLLVGILRVYELPKPVDVIRTNGDMFLPCEQPGLVRQILPVLSDRLFTQRSQQLLKLQPPLYPHLEELQGAVARSSTSPALAFSRYLQTFLGWQDTDAAENTRELDWIASIAAIGNSSDGNEFEKIVRRSLLCLGFTNSLNNPKASLDPTATGGAGGIDVYCDRPFPLVGECKATKHETVPSSVSAQLIHLGVKHLGQDRFNVAVKVIFAAGALTADAEQAATQNKMNVMTPETLQRLVTFHQFYPGAINLRELEYCLQQEQFGTAADEKIHRHLDQIYQNIRVRAKIIRCLRDHRELNTLAIWGLYTGSQPPQQLTSDELHEILIELSSPLNAYLGRGPESDYFYYLRDLPEFFSGHE